METGLGGCQRREGRGRGRSPSRWTDVWATFHEDLQAKGRFPGGSGREPAVWAVEGAGPGCLGLGAGWDLWVTTLCGGVGVTDLETRSCRVSIGSGRDQGHQSWELTSSRKVRAPGTRGVFR